MKGRRNGWAKEIKDNTFGVREKECVDCIIRGPIGIIPMPVSFRSHQSLRTKQQLSNKNKNSILKRYQFIFAALAKGRPQADSASNSLPTIFLRKGSEFMLRLKKPGIRMYLKRAVDVLWVRRGAIFYYYLKSSEGCFRTVAYVPWSFKGCRDCYVTHLWEVGSKKLWLKLLCISADYRCRAAQ